MKMVAIPIPSMSRQVKAAISTLRRAGVVKGTAKIEGKTAIIVDGAIELDFKVPK